MRLPCHTDEEDVKESFLNDVDVAGSAGVRITNL